MEYGINMRLPIRLKRSHLMINNILLILIFRKKTKKRTLKTYHGTYLTPIIYLLQKED